mmetsp:Transcript_112832/g.364260  ORF Transcript_112832/g.364260 Transcript_112832/m.364260 type:complete len:103 (-) Transcript_112832:133-441(-)
MASMGSPDLSSYERSAKKSPPVGWSASKSQSYFQDGRQGSQGLKDFAGPQGGAGGGSTGPSLPFRIIEAKYLSKPVGARALFTMTRPRQAELSKADSVTFQY